MLKKIFASLSLAVFICGVAVAEQAYELTEDVKLRLGGDIRARWEGFSPSVPNPDVASSANHPTTQYLRVRTRLKLALDFGEAATFNFRLGNRVHYVTTSPSNPNNNKAATWEFPDEVYVDELNVVLKDLGVENLTLTLGRQSLVLGNGMIISDPTPFDQGRSNYLDAAVLRYQNETDKLTALVGYSQWKDHGVFINDRNRRLNSADILTLGIYDTHTFDKALSMDAYVFFNNIDDEHPQVAERNFPADWSARLCTYGGRVFGAPVDWWDYSVELAGQSGRAAHHSSQGMMGDARMTFHLPDVWEIKPQLGFEYTYFSGDDAKTRTNEGWRPLLSQSPLWGDELIPILLNGNWSNLNSYKAFFRFLPMENTDITLSATEYYLDEAKTLQGGQARSGHGSHLGLLLYLEMKYTLNKNWSFMAQLSHFCPGNVFDNGCNGNWGRFQVAYSF